MKNFILVSFFSLMIITINQHFDEDKLNLFIRNYKQKQISQQNNNSISNFFSKELEGYSSDEIIRYNDYVDQ